MGLSLSLPMKLSQRIYSFVAVAVAFGIGDVRRLVNLNNTARVKMNSSSRRQLLFVNPEPDKKPRKRHSHLDGNLVEQHWHS